MTNVTKIQELFLSASAESFLLGSFIVLCGLLFVLSKGAVQRKKYPNGPWGLPFLGNLLSFGKYPPDTFARWKTQYGDVFSIKLGSWKAVVINGYERIKEACETDDDAFSSRPPFLSQTMVAKLRNNDSLLFGPFCTNYLLVRKVSCGALRMFTHRFEENTEKLIVQESNALADCLLSRANEARYIDFDVQNTIGTIIFQFLFGIGERLETSKELLSLIHSTEELKKLCGAGNALEVMPWLHYIMPWKVEQLKAVTATQDRIVLKQIKGHVSTFCRSNIRDVTDAVIEAVIEKQENVIAEKDMPIVLTILSDLLGAGFETSNQALQWLLLYMACYPDIQQRVQDEIDTVLGSRSVGLKDRGDLFFTESTIYEVMRKAALVAIPLPKYTTRNTYVGGYNIDRDTVVMLNFHSVLYDKDFWKDPENFRPDRFIDDRNQLDTTKCNRVVQFGIGRRRCVGEALTRMELFLMFTTIMQRCSIIKPKDSEIDLQPVVSLVCSPKKAAVIIKER